MQVDQCYNSANMWPIVFICGMCDHNIIVILIWIWSMIRIFWIFLIYIGLIVKILLFINISKAMGIFMNMPNRNGKRPQHTAEDYIRICTLFRIWCNFENLSNGKKVQVGQCSNSACMWQIVSISVMRAHNICFDICLSLWSEFDQWSRMIRSS